MPRGNPQNLTMAGKGRKKGSKNKFTNFKQSCLNVYEGLGGDKAFLKWAKKDPDKFYPMLAKLLPKPVEISVPPGEGLQLGVVMLPLAEEEPEAKGG